MGWRGVLRSAVAASRAADRERNRRANAVQRGHNQIDRIVDRLDSEVERDLEKLARVEERIHTKPLSCSGMSFDADGQRWTFKDLGDQTGQLKWTLNLEWQSDPVTGSAVVTDSSRTFQFLAMAATRWAVFVAFRISATDAAKPTKLFNKTNPSANRVLLVSNGIRYRAIEGQLDKELPIPGSDVGLVAFPIPQHCGDDLSIEFLLKSGTASLPLTTSNSLMFAETAKAQTLVEMTRVKLTDHTDPLREQAESTKQKMQDGAGSSGGWMFVAIVIGFLILVALVRS